MQDTQTSNDKGPTWAAGQAPSDAALATMASMAKARDVQDLSEMLRARCPALIRSLVEMAAQTQGVTPSEYIRRCVVGSLQADGLKVSPTAGELYDIRADGQTRFAMVENGKIVFVSYHDAKPEQESRVWMPVVHEDSEPFDIVRHWRLAPVFTIEADRVVCTFPVIPKSLEAF
jgi:hypothetical protein